MVRRLVFNCVANHLMSTWRSLNTFLLSYNWIMLKCYKQQTISHLARREETQLNTRMRSYLSIIWLTVSPQPLGENAHRRVGAQVFCNKAHVFSKHGGYQESRNILLLPQQSFYLFTYIYLQDIFSLEKPFLISV